MKKSNVQQKDELKYELKDELTVEFKEKDDFLSKFCTRRFGIVDFLPYICHTKRHSTSSFVHTHSSVFREYEIFITKGRVQ